MGRFKTVGVLLGLAGNALLGMALFHMLEIGSCGHPGMPPCPSSGWFIALPVGIVVSVLATILGGGGLIFVGTFLAVGLGSLAAGAFGHNPETHGFAYVFGGIFTGVALLMALAGGLLGRSVRTRVAQAEALVRDGARAVGTVTDVHDTGVTVNDNPRVHLRLDIRPEDGAPAFTGEKAVTVSRVKVPRVGDRFPVWYDRADPTRFALGTEVGDEAPPDVQALFAAAGRRPAASADPLGQIERLAALHRAGTLTDAEFEAAKARLLARLGEP
jgi:hypothetical protein